MTYHILLRLRFSSLHLVVLLSSFFLLSNKQVDRSIDRSRPFIIRRELLYCHNILFFWPHNYYPAWQVKNEPWERCHASMICNPVASTGHCCHPEIGRCTRTEKGGSRLPSLSTSIRPASSILLSNVAFKP